VDLPPVSLPAFSGCSVAIRAMRRLSRGHVQVLLSQLQQFMLLKWTCQSLLFALDECRDTLEDHGHDLSNLDIHLQLARHHLRQFIVACQASIVALELRLQVLISP